jgi:hypothetical protein
MKEKFCISCNTLKPITEFFSNGLTLKGTPKYKSHCNVCQPLLDRKRKLATFSQAYGKPFACEKCGYNKNFSALEFHHKDPSEKEFSFSYQSISYKRLKPEIDKCILLCSNCHKEEHHPQYNINPDGTFY